ncbi:MAG TPA: polymer-forming cytoskeletal protein [Nitrospira sp.]|nr:polymer-forming cytoskeletal protein [Nitrospira sp.]
MWDTKKRKVHQADNDNFTVLGKDVRFKGIVHFEGTVQLDSCFEGEIHSKGVLVVGEHAEIRGTITVGTLISSGKIQGTVAASDKVQLLKTAVQIGDVHAPTFLIEEGAYFKGFADMGAGPVADESSQNIDQVPDRTIRDDASDFRHRESE